MTEEELAGLSAEEREALAGDDAERDALKAVVDEAGGDDDDDADSAGGGDKEGAGDIDGGEAKTPVVAEEKDEPFLPVYHAEAVADYDAKVKALADERIALKTKFTDGDLTVDEYDEELAKLETQRDELRMAKAKAEIASEQNEQMAKQKWQWEIGRFMRSAAKEGFEYRVPEAQAAFDKAKESGDEAAITAARAALRTTRMLNSALDQVVKDLANDEDSQGLSDEAILERAHEEIKARFGKQAASPRADAKVDPKTAAINDRRPNLKAVPKALADVPAAGSDDSANGDSEFGHLDKLDGMELENAVAAMSKEKQDRWARSA